MRIRHFFFGLIAMLANGVCFADNGIEDGGADIRVFMKGSTVKVLLNYNQFVSTQLATNNPKLTQKNLEASIRMVIDRWIQVTGLNLKIGYGGTTTKTSPSAGEILIGAQIEAVVPGWRAGSYRNNTNDSTNGSCSTDFYRRTGSTEYNWHVFNYNVYPSGADFFHSTLMHEFGHCLGLQHNMNTDGTGQIATLRTVMTPGVNVHAGYGPYIEDAQDIVAMYGKRSSAKVDVLVSKDNGLSWATVNPNLQNLATSQAVIANRDNDRMMLFLTNLDHHPAYVMGSNGGDTWNSVAYFGGEHSLYGTSGSGFAGKYMMAWVDPEDQNSIKVIYTNDAAVSWWYRSPPSFRATGTPSIRQISSTTWILSYAYLDQDPYKNENGRILSSISTDDGQTWSTPVELSPGKRTLGGVTVASKDKNDIRIGFVQTNDGDDRWTTAITSISAYLDSNNALVFDGAGTSTAYASISDASFTSTSRVFVLGYRELNFSITSCNRDFDSSIWQQCASVASGYSGIPPTVVAKSNSNWAYMFKEK